MIMGDIGYWILDFGCPVLMFCFVKYTSVLDYFSNIITKEYIMTYPSFLPWKWIQFFILGSGWMAAMTVL
ncbi:hypothetical protein MTBBW1_900002 [Desulfamplus magnetovallimortis]|uniref:Uncharacterized protein n=1 Tax=Desulfamplus magnetovallimortis TaxID=1246637 RepID=A0A1W1HL30_9BACT|nr:hypothetical protein MTBBW1_900002 [Desulfamplus magnetovallimortis]